MQDWSPRHAHLVCVDSDGCVFDTMEIKHKECFCPAYIEHFHLQPVSSYAREAWEYVNLYSRTRGIHRLLALLRCVELLAGRSDVRGRGFTPPALAALRAWAGQGHPLTHAGLAAAARETASPDFADTLAWSEDVNARIGRMVHGIPPFPFARECLEAVAGQADLVVVSATATEALEREWRENGLMDRVSLVCGQEAGSKRDILAALVRRYPAGHTLMVGDAPGDLDAAHANGARFYPIVPAEEAASWKAFAPALETFLRGGYDESPLLARFLERLPEQPPWKAVG